MKDNYLLSLVDKAGNEHSISIVIEEGNEYIDFELNVNNYEMMGLSTLEGDVEIPETFKYEGNNYKITSTLLH